jgi:hypothetical protein
MTNEKVSASAMSSTNVSTSTAAVGSDPADRSVGDLVRNLSEDLSRLVRDEIRLAQAEVGEKAKKAGVGIGAFGGAGVAALVGRKKLQEAAPPVPKRAIATTKADVAEIKESIHR